MPSRVLLLALSVASAREQDSGLRFFRAPSVTRELALNVERDYNEYLNEKDRGLRPRNSKGCWRNSAACKAFAQNEEVLAAAVAATGASPAQKPLFLVSVAAQRARKGSRQVLHSDLDIWGQACTRRNSVTVWYLAEAEVDPLPTSPIYVITSTHSEKLANTTAQHTRMALGCDTRGGVFQEDERPQQPHVCSADGMTHELARYHPDLSFEVAHGPVKPGTGVTWPGRMWHEERDEAGRLSIMAQYATEECVRQMRRPRVYDIRNPFWQSGDWMPSLPVMGSITNGERQLPMMEAHPDAFDPLLMGPDLTAFESGQGVKQGMRCRAEYIRKGVGEATHHVAKGKGVYVIGPEEFPPRDRPSAIYGGGRVRSFVFPQTVSSPHIEYMEVVWSDKRGGIQLAHTPHVEPTDEIDVLFSGEVTYGVSETGDCGTFDVFDAKPGQVTFFPAGLTHVTRGREKHNSFEMLIKILPRGRSLDAQTRFLNSSRQALQRTDAFYIDGLNNSVLTSGGFGPSFSEHFSHHIFHASVSDAMGYSHLLGKVISYGPGARLPYYPVAHEYDLLVVPINGNITLHTAHAPPETVVKHGFALIPAGTPHNFFAEVNPVDVLNVEVSADGALARARQ